MKPTVYNALTQRFFKSIHKGFYPFSLPIKYIRNHE